MVLCHIKHYGIKRDNSPTELEIIQQYFNNINNRDLLNNPKCSNIHKKQIYLAVTTSSNYTKTLKLLNITSTKIFQGKYNNNIACIIMDIVTLYVLGQRASPSPSPNQEACQGPDQKAGPHLHRPGPHLHRPDPHLHKAGLRRMQMKSVIYI